jgi:hypothetical protein
MTDLSAEIAAELEAEDAREAEELAARQRQRRDALVPAMALSRAIAAAREEFAAADRERVEELTALVKQARKNGAPKARLDALAVEPLGIRKRSPRRTRRSESAATKPPAAGQPSSPESGEQGSSQHPIAV